MHDTLKYAVAGVNTAVQVLVAPKGCSVSAGGIQAALAPVVAPGAATYTAADMLSDICSVVSAAITGAMGAPGGCTTVMCAEPGAVTPPMAINKPKFCVA